MGYLMLFHEMDLDYTWSTYAAEGGNFGFFTSHDVAKLLNAKIYAEAKRLGVKYIIGGECGHMWRVVHQYMGTMNGPPDFLETPVSPVTGTRFEHAASTKAIHICEFTADLIRHGKLTLDPTRNDHRRVTFHDSCNVARGMGMLEEPRYLLRHACNHFFEMPEETIREQTFCCGSGAGSSCRRRHGTADAWGAPQGLCRKTCAKKTRCKYPCLHLRHRQGGISHPHGLLGAGGGGYGRSRTRGERPCHERGDTEDTRSSRRGTSG